MRDYKLTGIYLKVIKYVNKCDKKGTHIGLQDLSKNLNCRPDYIITIVSELLKEDLIKISKDETFFSSPKSITLFKNMHAELIEKIIFSFIIPIIVSAITAYLTAYFSVNILSID